MNLTDKSVKISSEDNSKPACEIDLDSIKNEFLEVDFHPLEAKPPDRYVYNVNFEHVRHTLNCYLRRPIKKQLFATNVKKLHIHVQFGQDATIEAAYPFYQTKEDWLDNTETVLSQEVDQIFTKTKKSSKNGIMKVNAV